MWLMCEAASYELIAARRTDVTYRMQVWLLAEGTESAEMWLVGEAASYELLAARRFVVRTAGW
jgi:hypothetical protein